MSTLSTVILIMAGIMMFFYGAGYIIEFLIETIEFIMEEEDERRNTEKSAKINRRFND